MALRLAEAQHLRLHDVASHKGRPYFRLLCHRYSVAVAASSTIISPSSAEDVAPLEQLKTSSVKYLLGRSEEQLTQLALSYSEKKYRGTQLHELLYKAKGRDLNEFLQLPKSFRERLIADNWRIGRSEIHHTVASTDGTLKALLKLEDARIIEAVGIPVEEARGINRLTVCVSSQVGCPLRCSFCATGKGGYSRNLKAHEIVDQVLTIEKLFQHRVTNVVFMGMGEPMLNLNAVLAAHKCLNEDVGIGQRMMTISTVGVPNTIARLAEHKLQSTLAISLHAPNQEIREKIVPSAKTYPLQALLADCKDYFVKTHRRISFEYTLLAGVNDGEEHAMELTDLLHKWRLGYHVNLIPYNPVSESDFKRPYKASMLAFERILNDRGVIASIRQTRGVDANAACGQLRNEFQKSPLK
ncbi:hypothetical protein GOP47_0001064 [Adiantum capillus-veneris]|uniref:Radical SAM core domain-containing protein n=1 Tax=Adiantum capillus-veneris TaxID=13818 RepID=A0A9D4ZTN1_ADICA|nr:hypothetical protein GOP47_0000224 [Adiantum capillus-veneris]KAI5084895.1 hypothetical protein GOP47_0001064 [Adiantum capillus-veneris]